jgi:AcrR family transcriptional regulator
MARPKRPSVTARKQPRQQRSTQMMADIVEAAVAVLRREGGRRFTTIRVAAEAGVSVGSLYQYFPNKEALLFRLQVAEWDATVALLSGILADERQSPSRRLRQAIVTFFRTELEEAELRRALDEVRAIFRGSAEAAAQTAKARALMTAFFRRALPRRSAADVAFAADFFGTAMGAIAERVTERALTGGELERWATATADLLCGHLERMQRQPAG